MPTQSAWFCLPGSASSATTAQKLAVEKEKKRKKKKFSRFFLFSRHKWGKSVGVEAEEEGEEEESVLAGFWEAFFLALLEPW